MILLDTDTVTHFSYGNENVRRKIEKADGEVLAVAVVTRNQILRGRADNLEKAATEDELRKAAMRLRQSEELLADFVTVHVDEAAIGHFGRLVKQKSLKKIGRADLLIGCIALANDALLVTRNTKDFRPINGLRIENWVDG